MNTLVHLPYSPWSVKARWALRVAAVPVRLQTYTPMLGEPLLRVRTGRFSGPLTVPVLLRDDMPPLLDSWEIARWAFGVGDTTWAPAEHSAEIERWNAKSEQLLAAGRALGTLRLVGDREALRESVPPPFDRVEPLADLLGWVGVRFFVSKYDLEDAASAARPILALGLDELERALDGRAWLLDRPSYADVAMAMVLQFVQPVERNVVPLGARSRELWGDAELAARHPALIAWRDRVVEAVRAVPVRR